jgi:capsid protein
LRHFRWNVLVPFICDPVWRRFVDACRIGGLVPTETTYDVDWSPPAFDLLDRKIEADADQAMLRIGTMTWPQAVGRQGYDPTKQLDQISEYNKKFDDAGVILDCDPRRVARTGVSQQAPAADQQPPAA